MKNLNIGFIKLKECYEVKHMIAGNVRKEDVIAKRDKCDCGGIFVKIEANTLFSTKLFEIDQICGSCGRTRKSKK